MGVSPENAGTESPPPLDHAGKLPFWGKVYAALTFLLGAGAVSLSVLDCHAGHWARFAVFLTCAVAASSLKVSLPGIAGARSVNYLFILIGVMMLDLPQTLLVGVACRSVQFLSRPRRRPKPADLVLHLSGSAIAVACSYLVYHAVWLRRLDGSMPTLLFAAAMAYFLASTFCSAGTLSLTGGGCPWKIWRESFLWTAPQYLASAALAGLLKLCTERIGWQGPLLVLPALYLIYRSYRIYLQRLEEEQQRVSRMADLHLRTIEALALAIEAKDSSAHDNLSRVRFHATEMARELGASADEIQALSAAALLHDIGKLAVPEYILSKPGRLTPEEFEKIKIHPAVGAAILRPVRFPYPVAAIVEAHHEKWDGSGYPYGLKGEAIPLGARILAAADCLDALSSDRQYRSALPLDEAIEFIVSQSGISFDPRVVNVLKRRYRGWRDRTGAAAEPDGGPASWAGTRAPQTRPPELENVCTPDRRQSRTPSLGNDPPNFTVAIAAARQEFQTLHEVTSELGNSLSMEGTMSLLGTRLKGIVPHDAITIYVCRGDRLIPQYVQGRDFQLFSSLAIPIGQGLSGWVAEHGKAIVNGNPSVEPGYLNAPAKLSNLNSAISVPLVGVNGVLGALTLYHAQRDAFTRDHLRLLLAISSKAALTIENALKYREVQRSAVTDDLTGLPNTRSLFLHLDNEVARCKRTNTHLAVLVADLDGFKLVNDRFGHLAGNNVLKKVAHGLTRACREYDYVARMGGDEFVLILPGMTAGALARKSQDLCAMVRDAGRDSTGEELVSLSVGEAFFPEDGADAEELLSAADRRMYQVKRSHRTERVRGIRLKDLAQAPAESASGPIWSDR